MSVHTDDAVVSAPATQVATLPRNIGVPARVHAVLSNLSREAVSTAIATDTVESYAKDVAGAFQWATATGAKIEDSRTLTGAYVYRLMGPDGAGHTLGEIAEMLGVGNSSVTRYRYISRLYFDFGFGPEDGSMWSVMVNQLVSKSAFVAVLKDKDAQKSAVLAKFAELTGPKPSANVGGSAEETVDGQETTSRGAQEPRGAAVPQNNAGILAEVQKFLSNLKADSLSAQEWATLHTIGATVEGLLDSAPEKVRNAGQKITAKGE